MGRTPGTPERVGRARLRAVIAFASFALGLALARAFDGAPSWWWFLGAVALAVGAAPARGVVARAALIAAMAGVGGGWWTLRFHETARDDLAGLVDHGGGGPSLLTLEGLALTTPRARDAAPALFDRFIVEAPRSTFEMETRRAVTDSGPVPVSGRVWVRTAGAPPPVRAGDAVRVTGVFEGVETADNPGEEDPRLLAAQRGFAGQLKVSGAELVTAGVAESGWWLRTRGVLLRAQEAMRERARAVVERAVGDDPEPRALVRGLLLGEFDPSAEDLRGAFARQGLAHALSISGFHLAVMAWVMLTLLRLTGDRGWLEPVVVALLVLAYMLIVPASSPIVRSGVMVLVLLASESLGRRYDRLTVLAWIGVGLLAWRPLDLWSLGFQLSLGLTGVLLWLGGRFGAAMWGEPLKGLSAPRELPLLTVLRAHAKSSVGAAALCWIVSLPTVLYFTGQFSPLGVLASVLVTPLLVLVLWAGYLALLAGMVLPAAAGWGSAIVHGLATAAAWSVRGLDALPGSSITTPPVPVAWVWAATAFVLAWVRWGDRRRGGWWAAGALLATAWLIGAWTLGARLPRGVEARIDTLAVGDGTCHVIRSGGDALLWDCGRMRAGGIRPAVVRSLRALGVHRTPTLVITHPDMDHFGGLEQAVEGLGVRHVLVPERFVRQAAAQPDGAAAIAISYLKGRGVDVRVVGAGDSMRLGSATLAFLSPPSGAAWPLDNDHSLVAAVRVRDRSGSARSILLTGDVEDRAISALSRMELRPDVLEVPHHGSARDAAIDWTSAMDPPVVIQSTGPSRAGDPRWERVREGRAWLCTATGGAAWAELRSDGTVRAGSVRSPALRGRERRPRRSPGRGSRPDQRSRRG